MTTRLRGLESSYVISAHSVWSRCTSWEGMNFLYIGMYVYNSCLCRHSSFRSYRYMSRCIHDPITWVGIFQCDYHTRRVKLPNALAANGTAVRLPYTAFRAATCLGREGHGMYARAWCMEEHEFYCGTSFLSRCGKPAEPCIVHGATCTYRLSVSASDPDKHHL